MDKEKIFIINYFNKNDMRWYEQETYESRDKYINTLTGEQYNSLEEATKAKTDFLKETKANNDQGKVESGKLKEVEDYQENLAKLEDVNIEEEAEFEEQMTQEQNARGKSQA